jgi:membrane protein YqaA with SNARE-associated domain
MKEKRRKFFKAVLQSVIVILLIGAAFTLARIAADSSVIRTVIQNFGYVGLFIIAVVSGFNVIVPVPAIALLPVFAEAGLSLVWTVFIISIGMTVGDFLGFLIGDTGRKILETTASKKRVRSLQKLKEKNPRLPLIALFAWASAAPLPNELIVIPIAFLGYKLRNVMIIVLAGNTVFNSLVAYGIITVYNAV